MAWAVQSSSELSWCTVTANLTRDSSIWLVILSWNDWNSTASALASVDEPELPSIRRLVVDNGSASPATSKVLALANEVLRNESNLGFARGINRGIRYAFLHGADTVVILNNDAHLYQDSLARLITGMRGADAGVASGLILRSADGPISYAGGRPQVLRASVTVPHRGQAVGDGVPPSRYTGFCTGAFMAISREAYEVVGALPEEYFFGMEEVDYSLAIRQAGLLLWYESSAVCVHRGRGSHPESMPRYVYSGYRNKIIFALKYQPIAIRHAWFVVFVLYSSLILPLLHNRRHRGTASHGRLGPLALRAAKDHVLGRPLDEAQILSVEGEVVS